MGLFFFITGLLAEEEVDGADCFADLVDLAGGGGASFSLTN